VTRNNRLLIGIAVAAAVLGAYWFLILAPKRAQAAELETSIAAKQASIQQIEATAGQYALQRDAYRSNYTTLVRLGKAVPADDDLRSLMIQIDDAARRSGVDFRTIDVGGGSSAPTVAGTSAPLAPGSVSLGTGFSAMPFKFTFTGRFADLGGFFARLERFVTVQEHQVRVTGRLMRIESITLAPGQGGYPQILASIGASSYLASTPAGVSQAGAPTTAPAVPASAPASGTTTPTTTATATGAIR
jgi:Tfp pilus assembly protein PilO